MYNRTESFFWEFRKENLGQREQETFNVSRLTGAGSPGLSK